MQNTPTLVSRKTLSKNLFHGLPLVFSHHLDPMIGQARAPSSTSQCCRDKKTLWIIAPGPCPIWPSFTRLRGFLVRQVSKPHSPSTLIGSRIDHVLLRDPPTSLRLRSLVRLVHGCRHARDRRQGDRSLLGARGRGRLWRFWRHTCAHRRRRSL